jgi:hypothetical protein
LRGSTLRGSTLRGSTLRGSTLRCGAPRCAAPRCGAPGPAPENQTENFAFLQFAILHNFPVVQAPIRVHTRKPNVEFRPSQVHNSLQLPRCTSTNHGPHPKTRRRILPFSGRQFSTASKLYRAPIGTLTRKPNGEFRPSQVHNSPFSGSEHFAFLRFAILRSFPVVQSTYSRPSQVRNSPRLPRCTSFQPVPSPENQTENFALLRYTIFQSFPVVQAPTKTDTRKPNGEFRPSQVHYSPQRPRCTSTNQDPHRKNKRRISPFSGTQFSTASPLYKHQ